MNSYEQNLQEAIDLRNQIKQAIPNLKYKRAYTRRKKNNECETILWGLNRDSRREISKFVVSDNFIHENPVGFGMQHSIVTKTGIRYVGKLCFKLITGASI